MDESGVENELRIQRTLAEYCHLCDDGQFGSLVERFTSDGTFVYGDEVVSGRPALERWFASQQPPEWRGKHLTMNAIIDVSGDRARAESDFVFLRATNDGVSPSIAGRYRDDLRRVGGRWLIERREVDIMAPPRR